MGTENIRPVAVHALTETEFYVRRELSLRESSTNAVRAQAHVRRPGRRPAARHRPDVFLLMLRRGPAGYTARTRARFPTTSRSGRR